MLSKEILLILSFLFINLGFAQQRGIIKIDTNRVHQFIYELHEEDAKTFIKNNEAELDVMKTFLEKNIYFIQYKKIPSAVTEKLSDYSPKNTKYAQTKFNPIGFNPFLYGLDEVNSPKKIHIDGTNYVLFINPNTED